MLNVTMGAGCHLNGAHVIAPKCRGITYYTDGRGNIPRMHNSAYAEKFPQYYAAHKVLTSLRKQYRDSVMGSGVSAYSNLFNNHASCIIPILSLFLFIPSLHGYF